MQDMLYFTVRVDYAKMDPISAVHVGLALASFAMSLGPRTMHLMHPGILGIGTVR